MPEPLPVTNASLTGPATSLRILILVVFAGAVWMVLPFADALLIAVVVAILAWPLHLWIRRRVPRPRVAATLLTLLALTVGLVGPLVSLAWLVSRELAALAAQLAAEFDQGDLDSWVNTVARLPFVAWLLEQAGGRAAVVASVRTNARDGLAQLATDLGQSLPTLVGGTARAVLKLAIFYLAVGTLFHRGTEFGRWATRMSPIAERHTRRLFEVFAEFSRNVVLAGVVAAAVQGAVAGIGYWIGGVDRPLLFAVLTGVLAFIPFIGTAAAWVPVTLLLLLQDRAGAALFVAAWSILLTGTVDNVVKPLIVRGRSDLPALLVFLGVFGGLLWFGVIGLLVGPALMALLVALLRIHAETAAADAQAGSGDGPPLDS